MRLFAVLLMALPVPATAFTAQNGMEARQLNSTDIAVDFKNDRRDTQYWCAAGELAQQQMHLPVSTKMWRASPKPRKQGQGIVFTLDEAKKAEGAGLSQFGSGPRDGAMPIGHAVAIHCRPVIPDFARSRD